MWVCDRATIPFIARGAGTGLSGGALPVEDCVLIVTALMRQILNIDLENQRVVAAGVINNWVTKLSVGLGTMPLIPPVNHHLLNWRQRSGELRRRPLPQVWRDD